MTFGESKFFISLQGATKKNTKLIVSDVNFMHRSYHICIIVYLTDIYFPRKMLCDILYFFWQLLLHFKKFLRDFLDWVKYWLFTYYAITALPIENWNTFMQYVQYFICSYLGPNFSKPGKLLTQVFLASHVTDFQNLSLKSIHTTFVIGICLIV